MQLIIEANWACVFVNSISSTNQWRLKSFPQGTEHISKDYLKSFWRFLKCKVNFLLCNYTTVLYAKQYYKRYLEYQNYLNDVQWQLSKSQLMFVSDTEKISLQGPLETRELFYFSCLYCQAVQNFKKYEKYLSPVVLWIVFGTVL